MHCNVLNGKLPFKLSMQMSNRATEIKCIHVNKGFQRIRLYPFKDLKSYMILQFHVVLVCRKEAYELLKTSFNFSENISFEDENRF
jgi:hypothetical protein